MMSEAPLVVLLILIVNAIFGVWQENNAKKNWEALQEIQSELAVVICDSRRVANLPAEGLVPGDIVEVKAGDKVPADMRIWELISFTLWVEQGSLTGESEAVNANIKSFPIGADIPAKKCMVFAGTTVVNGIYICLVTQTAMLAELSKAHPQIHKASQLEDDTLLKEKNCLERLWQQ